jgi:hypothetical protein
MTYKHRWASFPQKATVTSFPFLAKYKIETVTSFSLTQNFFSFERFHFLVLFAFLKKETVLRSFLY